MITVKEFICDKIREDLNRSLSRKKEKETEVKLCLNDSVRVGLMWATTSCLASLCIGWLSWRRCGHILSSQEDVLHEASSVQTWTQDSGPTMTQQDWGDGLTQVHTLQLRAKRNHLDPTVHRGVVVF